MHARADALAEASAPPPSSTLGLSLHLRWGDQRVGEYFLRPSEGRAFRVGSSEGVDFAMGHALLGARSFDVVRSDLDGFVLRFTDRMDGWLERDGATTPLTELQPGEVTLEPGDRAEVDLGGVALEASFDRIAPIRRQSLSDVVDYTVLNAFLALFFVGAVAVITAINSNVGVPAPDDIGGSAATVAKVLMRAPPLETARHIGMGLMHHEPERTPLAHSGREGMAGKPDAPDRPTRAANVGKPGPDRAREIIKRLFAGPGSIANAVAGPAGLDEDLKAAIGGIAGERVGDARGAWGMGLRDDGPGGGGPGNSNSIGVELRVPSHGHGDYRLPRGEPGLGPPDSLAPEIPPPTYMGCGGEGRTPCLDKELIRRVIHRNRSQLRYCYEEALIHRPSLGGKVSVVFTIAAAQGAVSEAAVASSSLGDPKMESCVVSRVRSWIFPRVPAGWVKVTYPFVFRLSGE
jgi:hypothetical protein